MRLMGRLHLSEYMNMRSSMLPLSMIDAAVLLGVGFALAMPFFWIRNYVVRLLLCVCIPLALLSFLTILGNPHPGIPWRLDVALCFIVGGLCAALLRDAWERIRARIEHGRSNAKPTDSKS